jgi:hypothetical protein
MWKSYGRKEVQTFVEEAVVVMLYLTEENHLEIQGLELHQNIYTCSISPAFFLIPNIECHE